MAVFIVATIHEANDAILGAKIAEQFPDDNYQIGRGQWLVAFNGTARDLYTKMVGEIDPSAADKKFVVFGIGGYFGVHARDIWEWMATKLGGKFA